ncbi:F0F1 ATP synthase subunit gamma [Phytomonospora endophytica]|uniref:ATP synthase gamma chain n=1 Tax=Phytomonospora endophytica TaxID=714109 RepID=A0A841F7I8_9ACTN|nr:F0F1 ATP synthase subunit gamma [Phytomonospora endophytica]MBB6032176.1 F-type H+-transporting ATPase subunit gamma [Phytomonospora endophytica]GIG68525.1 ATP synthase gamma chain [Phytomonospora endophytica]
MGAQLRVLRRRIASTQSIKKITKAQELVATSRIGKAQERVAAALPYAKAITGVLTALASNCDVNHPLLVPRPVVRRAGVLVITSDKGQCGGYNSNVLRTAERLVARLAREDKNPVLYVTGGKGAAYYKFRGRELAGEWAGFSQKPTVADAQEVAKTLIRAFVNGADDDLEHPGPDGILGVDELFIVSTHFVSMVAQTPQAHNLAPMQVEDVEGDRGLLPAYEFEPEAEELLDALLPKYLVTRVYAALIDAAVSESAARRTAMKNATDNAEEMIKTLTRQRNAARQAEITQEISEIVGGANALAAAGSDD